jgi:phosphatidylglycerophosphatase A
MVKPSPPPGMAPSNPAWIVATWFGVGYIPKAPGTLASLSALPFAWAFQHSAGPIGLMIAAALAYGAGFWACGKLIKPHSTDDPGHIVIDEVAGQWLTFVPLAWLMDAPEPLFYLTGFLLFRLFDIMKPWPADRAQRLNGATGIMIDDLFAAIYAGAGTAFIYAYTYGLGPFSR